MQTLCVTGPLGAGKTTTLVRLVASDVSIARRQLRLIVNEVGDFQVDVTRLREDLDSTIAIDSLTAGCLGCENAAEFNEIVSTLSGQDGLMAIEPTGVADTREIKEIIDRYDLSWACLTLVNPETFRRNRLEGILAAQLSVATMVGITWLDGLERQPELEYELMAYIAEHAGGVPIVRLQPTGKLPVTMKQLLAGAIHDVDCGHDHSGHHHGHDHGSHGHFTTAITLRPEVTADELREVLAPIRDLVVRAKGVVGGHRFDLVGSRVKIGATASAQPHIQVITTQPFSSDLFIAIRAASHQLHDKKRLMTQGEGTFAEIIDAIKFHAASYPEPIDGDGFPKLGAEADIAGWLARRPEVPDDMRQLAMTARMEFLVGAAAVLNRAVTQGLYNANPQRLARDQLELGAALAWNVSEKPELMSRELVQHIVQVQPAHMALAGLGNVSALSLDLLSDDAKGPTTPSTVAVVARFGIGHEGLSTTDALAAMQHAAGLAAEYPLWSKRWQDAIDEVRVLEQSAHADC